MPNSVWTWATALPLIIAVIALLTTLALSVPAAYRESRALRAAQAQGRFMEPIRAEIARAVKRRELLRVVKHAVVITGIALSLAPMPMYRAIALRNCCFCAISILMLSNTILDHLTRRRALRYLAERN
jgi:hypothetical protein